MLDRPAPHDGEQMVDDVTGANRFIEQELRRRIQAIEKVANADVITCIHPISSPFDDFIKESVEDITIKKENLLVILETEGGSIETTERISDVFRHHYVGEVSFIVPNSAMSAGTILVMSGDNIYMDYYSALGPIDPQIMNQNGQYVPALGYLEKYNQLVKKSAKGGLSQAELAMFIDKFDPAEMHRFEQAREHSVDLLEKWLVRYKFKNWKVTQTKGITVTPKMKADRAKEIAKKLNDTKLWRSHGRGLSINVFRNDLNLLIDDFGEDPKLADLKRTTKAYYRLLQDYMQKRGKQMWVQTAHGYIAF